ncbi:MAG: hypothetical protein OXU61_06950, partial [Gammaproteobacteria bacterium]|nr:hypothetical protein [Gammaproteobacteria bacterium]
SGESRNPAQIQRGTRTLQNLTARPSLHGIFLQRSAKRALSMRDSGFRRNDGVKGRNDGVKGRNGGVKGRNGGVGFIRWMPAGFLHRLFRRNGGRAGEFAEVTGGISDSGSWSAQP